MVIINQKITVAKKTWESYIYFDKWYK